MEHTKIMKRYSCSLHIFLGAGSSEKMELKHVRSENDGERLSKSFTDSGIQSKLNRQR